MQFPVDLGDGFMLVQLAEPHAVELNRTTIRNLARLRAWEGWAWEPQTPAHTEAYITQRLRVAAAGQAVPCLIMHGTRVVGTIELRIDESRHSGELGYWLDHGVVGQGLVTRAGRALVQYAGDLGIEHLRLRISETNTRSLAVAERLGFTRQELTTETMLVGTRLHTMLVYVLE